MQNTMKNAAQERVNATINMVSGTAKKSTASLISGLEAAARAYATLNEDLTVTQAQASLLTPGTRVNSLGASKGTLFNQQQGYANSVKTVLEKNYQAKQQLAATKTQKVTPELPNKDQSISFRRS